MPGWLWLRGVRSPSRRICSERVSRPSLDFHSQHVLHCVRVLPRIPFPIPPPSLSSSGFATANPTFSSIKEIRDYNLHLNPQTVLDSHPFGWWSFLLSSPTNGLFPVKFFSSLLQFILHSRCRHYLYHVFQPSDQAAREGYARFRPPVCLCPIALLPSLPLQPALVDLNAGFPLSRNAWAAARASPNFSPAMNSGRLPNGPPPSQQQQPKDTGSFPPLNQQNGARPQETDRTLQSLTGLIVCASAPL